MTFLSFLYRHGIWISVPVFLISAAALVFFIVSVIRVVRQAQILSVPLVEEQQVEFAETGRVILCMEGPHLSTRFGGLAYELTEMNGAAVKGGRIWAKAITSGTSKARVELEYYEIPRPGPYILYVKGLKADHQPDSDHKVVFVRPHRTQTIVRVVGIVLSGVLLIGSLVLFFIRLTSPGGAQ